MTQRVYGISLDACDGHNADSLFLLSNEEKKELLAQANEDDVEMYEIDKWFMYLNNDMIDTENYYWFIA